MTFCSKNNVGQKTDTDREKTIYAEISAKEYYARLTDSLYNREWREDGDFASKGDVLGSPEMIAYLDTYEKTQDIVGTINKTIEDFYGENDVSLFLKNDELLISDLSTYEPEIFKEKSLLLVVYCANSGSYKIELKDVIFSDGVMTVCLESPKINGYVTCDMHTFAYLAVIDKYNVTEISYEMKIKL